jgi:hypothetical protein
MEKELKKLKRNARCSIYEGYWKNNLDTYISNYGTLYVGN